MPTSLLDVSLVILVRPLAWYSRIPVETVLSPAYWLSVMVLPESRPIASRLIWTPLEAMVGSGPLPVPMLPLIVACEPDPST
jgi:hypothetical protein